MMPPCPNCERIHSRDDVTAIDRFRPEGPSGYQAHIPDAPIRKSRLEAEQDWCDYYAAKEAEK